MKLSINHIRRGIHGENGTWSECLVSEFGRRRADKVVLRPNETMAAKIQALLNIAIAKEQVLTVECAEFPEASVKGIAGVRTESFVTKAGESVSQTALYLKLGVNPDFKLEANPSTGNIDALMAEHGVTVGDVTEVADFNDEA